MPHKRGVGAILGIVSEDGVPRDGYPVNLYDRTTGNLVSRRMSDENGGFVFSGLNPETDDYQVATQDETGPPYKNAIIRDRIQPIFAHMGGTYYAAWRYLALRKSPLVILTGEENGDHKRFVPHIVTRGPSVINRINNAYQPLDVSDLNAPLVGAPQYGEVAGTNEPIVARGCFDGAGAESTENMRADGSSSFTDFAFEFVIDFDKLDADFVAAMFVHVTGWYSSSSSWNGGCAATVLGALVYSHSAKEMRFYSPTILYTGESIDGRNRSLDHFSKSVMGGNPIDTSGFSGLHHLLFSGRLRETLDVYVDGSVEQMYVNTDFDASYINAITDGYTNYLVIAKATASSASLTSSFRDVNIGPSERPSGIVLCAVYPRQFGAVDAQEHYDALTGDSIPPLTGVGRDIFIHSPIFYSRLNNTLFDPGDPSITVVTSADPFMDGQIFNAGPATLAWDAPPGWPSVNALVFDGATALQFNKYGYGHHDTRATSAVFVARFDNNAPGKDVVIARECGVDTNSRSGLEVALNGNGEIKVNYTTTNSGESVTFSGYGAVDDQDFHFYVIVIDVHSGDAILYVDGGVAESVAISSAYSLAVAEYARNSRITNAVPRLIVGGVPSGGGVTNGVEGAISDVAIFAKSLGPSAISAMYDALETI